MRESRRLTADEPGNHQPTYMVENDLVSKKLVEIWVDPNPSDDWLGISWAKDHLEQTRIKRIVNWIASEFE